MACDCFRITNGVIPIMMRELNLDENKTALVVVAHPDDETIWMGGTIARNTDLSWTVFVLCRESDPDRMPKFKKIIRYYYKANGVICDLEDEGILNISQSIPEIKKIIRKRLPQKKIDYIFTHGSKGDYGHPRHIAVYRAVSQMIKDKELAAKNVFYFAYERKPENMPATPVRKAGFYTKLSNLEWRKKRDVMKKLYGFSKMSFENRSCSKVETFSGR